jgi:hypothetical protein
MRSIIHPINETKRLIDEIQAFLPTMIDRRRAETHQDARKALLGGPDTGRHAGQPANAAAAR